MNSLFLDPCSERNWHVQNQRITTSTFATRYFKYICCLTNFLVCVNNSILHTIYIRNQHPNIISFLQINSLCRINKI